MIVADTHLVAYLLIEGERTQEARRVWEHDADWRLPPLWRSEFLNVLATAVRTGVLEGHQAQVAWLRATALFDRSEHEPGGEAVLSCALDTGLSAYDAQFVTVARDLSAPGASPVPLVTTDRAILAACPDIATAPETFATP